MQLTPDSQLGGSTYQQTMGGSHPAPDAAWPPTATKPQPDHWQWTPSPASARRAFISPETSARAEQACLDPLRPDHEWRTEKALPADLE